ncbi:hypothetical protein L1987_80259 [Smallanthus sonchifolius]|uniref:Uncharacterized protein n=1 Tax=Smallanthus sonchifolius TaxID=185202 RepID=A0ACB8YLF3_9ASTR|nr:hypothetical protein L1987_80259 [Smallanthus sonchifolius]
MRPQIKQIETSCNSGTHRHIKILSYSLSSHSLIRKSQIFPAPAILPNRICFRSKHLLHRNFYRCHWLKK